MQRKALEGVVCNCCFDISVKPLNHYDKEKRGQGVALTNVTRWRERLGRDTIHKDRKEG
jgi:hypothetical protein